MNSTWKLKLQKLTEFLKTFLNEAEKQHQNSNSSNAADLQNSSSNSDETIQLTPFHTEKIFELLKELLISLCIHFPLSNNNIVAPWKSTTLLSLSDSSQLFNCWSLLFHCVLKYPSSKTSPTLHSPDFIRLFHILSIICSTFSQNPSMLAILLRKSQIELDPQLPSSPVMYSLMFTALIRIKTFFLSLDPNSNLEKNSPVNDSTVLYHFIEYLLLIHRFLQFLSLSGELEFGSAILKSFINIHLPKQAFSILPFIAFEMSLTLPTFSYSNQPDHKGLIIYLVDAMKNIPHVRNILVSFLQSLELSYSSAPGFLSETITSGIRGNKEVFDLYTSSISLSNATFPSQRVSLDGSTSDSLFAATSILRNSNHPNISKEEISDQTVQFTPFTRNVAPLSFSPLFINTRP